MNDKTTHYLYYLTDALISNPKPKLHPRTRMLDRTLPYLTQLKVEHDDYYKDAGHSGWCFHKN